MIERENRNGFFFFSFSFLKNKKIKVFFFGIHPTAENGESGLHPRDEGSWEVSARIDDVAWSDCFLFHKKSSYHMIMIKRDFSILMFDLMLSSFFNLIRSVYPVHLPDYQILT